MEPSYASLLHIAVSLVAALAAGPLIAWWRREGGVILSAAGGFLAALLLGQAKETYDLLTNPWHMTAADLRADSAEDMGCNLVGATVGALLFMAAVAAISAVRRRARAARAR